MRINPCDPSSVQLFQWKCVSCPGNRQNNVESYGGRDKINPTVPCGRIYHAACSQGQFVYVLGGKDRYSPLKDFWKLDLVNEKWDRIDNKKIDLPHLEGHTMLAYKSELLIFGGTFCDTGDDTPLWIFNTDLCCLRKWCEPSSQQPSGRREHSAVIYKNSMYIFGGFLDNSGSTDEFWLFNIEEETWQEIPRSQPGKRHGHVAVVASNNMWLHGGMKELVALSDLWIFNFSLCTWTKIKGQGMSPTLANHTGHIFEKWLILIGGTQSSQLSHYVWLFRFDTQSWSQTSIQPEDNYPPLSLHASVLLKASVFQCKYIDQVKSLPQLPSSSVLTACESVRPHTAFTKHENSSDSSGSDVGPFKNVNALFQNCSNTKSQSSRVGAEVLKLDCFDSCGTRDEVVRRSEAETSFTVEPLHEGPLQLRANCIINVDRKEMQRPASSELVHDSLPLLQRFHSVTSDDDLGVSNLSVSLSDEQVNTLAHPHSYNNKSAVPVNNPVKRNFEQESNNRNLEKNLTRTSLMKKIIKQKAGKSHQTKDVKLTHMSEATDSNFENPFYTVLYDERINWKNYCHDKIMLPYTSSLGEKLSKPRAPSQSRDDLLLEDLEWLDSDQLFKAGALCYSDNHRVRSLSCKDISNYALSPPESCNSTLKKFKRQNSKSCETLSSISVQQCVSATLLQKQLLASDREVVQTSKKSNCDSTKLNASNCEKFQNTNIHLRTSQNFFNKLYTLQNSIGVQTSDSLLCLDEPKGQLSDLAYGCGASPSDKTTKSGTSKNGQRLADVASGILGDSELCILVLGGETEHVSFKSEPLRLWKCHLS